MVPNARIDPYWSLEFISRNKTIEPAKLDVGTRNRDCTWIKLKTNQVFHFKSTPRAIHKTMIAVAMLTQRSTVAGRAERSAIAPKKRGESNAAMAVAANAIDLIAPIPAASNTELRGTNHDAIAMPCKNKSPINSAFSVRFNSRSK